MRGRTGEMAWLYLGLAYVLLFHRIQCDDDANGETSLSDEINDIPLPSGDTVKQNPLNDRTSDISGNVNGRNAKLQSDFNADGVSDAKTTNRFETNFEYHSIQTFEESVAGEEKPSASTDVKSGATRKNLEESLTDRDKPLANAQPQSGLKSELSEKSVDNFEALLANLDKPDNLKTLLADQEKLFAGAQQPDGPEEELNGKNLGSFKEDETVGLSGKNADNIKDLLLDEDKLLASKDVNVGLLGASVDTLAQNPPNVTLLAKMRDLMNYEDFISDTFILGSFDWFDETSTVKSRIRRASEPYHYRRFQQPLRAYIPENSPPGTKVLEIPRNFDGLLEIVHPENSIFRVQSETGILETIETLDFEIQKVYNLIIRDSETDDSLFYSHDVIVYVTDENDNEPEFAMMPSTSHVNTASRVGSFVAQLNASDPDSRERGRLGFIIGGRNSLFTVNPRTWVMQTNGKPLDTSQTNFPVTIRVFDQGYPRQESPTQVINVNKGNNPPRFSQSQYTFTYPETMLPGVVIGRVMAMSLSNIPVGYEVVPSSDVFMINRQGELSLKRSIDYETAGSLATVIITIRASELTDSDPLSSQVSVTLVVTNYDENPTMFTEVIYNAQIDEDVGIGTFVTSVTVTDCDCSADCQCTGNEFDFTLMDANGYFDISETGDTRTAKDFDYDIQSVYEFAVLAWDRTGNHGDSVPARAYVRVKLRDVNNNAPRFSESRYRFVVDEDSEINHLVGVVQATDKDNLGSPLSYTITASSPKSGLFQIPDSRFGIVVVASSLKAETESVFTLTVEATDGVQSSQTVVEVESLLLYL
jgi:hypothetical protein